MVMAGFENIFYHKVHKEIAKFTKTNICFSAICVLCENLCAPCGKIKEI